MSSQRISEAATSSFNKAQLEQMARSVPAWFHSIELGQGVVTPGHKTAERLAYEIEVMKLPDLQRKTVLDIGAWDGFFSFEAERRGASRVVALDHFIWAKPFAGQPEPERGVLPHKACFDIAHTARGSRVEAVVNDLMDADLERLGTFDVVFFLGGLYHMEDPMAAMRRVWELTRELAIIETEAIAIHGWENEAIWQFFEGDELANDPTIWFIPNENALTGICRAVGFSRAEILVGRPPEDAVISEGRSNRWLPWKSQRKVSQASPPEPKITRYRAVAHAWK